jgi:hypothetical protein
MLKKDLKKMTTRVEIKNLGPKKVRVLKITKITCDLLKELDVQETLQEYVYKEQELKIIEEF